MYSMLFFIQTLPCMCAGAISRVSFLDLFGPIAAATNPIYYVALLWRRDTALPLTPRFNYEMAERV